MQDLYISTMEKVMPILQEHWQLTLVAVGMLFFFGAVFNWKWTWDPNGHKTFGFNGWVYRNFGEAGARIKTAIVGGVIVVYAVTVWILM